MCGWRRRRSALWRELEAESGETVLDLHGLVEVVRTLEESTAHTLERCGVAWERLDREEAERRFPIRVPEGSFAVVQPEAGIARADKALAAFAASSTCARASASIPTRSTPTWSSSPPAPG